MSKNKGAKIAITIGLLAALSVGGYFVWNTFFKSSDKNPNPNPNGEASSTRFKNETEGNKFRAWVNDKHPEYAATLMGDGLDRSGSYDNSYINKAYQDYGSEYDKLLKQWV